MRRRVLVGVGGIAVVVAFMVAWWVYGARGEQTRSSPRRKTGGRIGMSMPREQAKPATLSGRVIRASDGTAIPGAVVAIAVERHVWGESAPPIVVTSGTDGQWTTSDVAPGTYALAVTAIGFAPQTRELAAIAAGEQRTGVDVSLDVGGVLVTGTISADSHAPIANARVRAYRDGGAPYFVAFSGADGRYQLSLAAGPHQLEVTHDEYRRASQNIGADDKPVTADFVLTRGGVIRGKVIARDTGKPVPVATVLAVGGRDFSNTRAGNDGTFTLRGVHDGTISINARGRGYASVTPTIVELDTGEQVADVRVTVDPAVSIVGRVVAKNDHARGIGGVMVNAMQFRDRPWPVSEVSDGDGNFELVGMLSGPYILSADKRGMLFEGDVQVEVVDTDVTDVLIEMRSGATLSGRVEPPVVAKIALARPGGDLLGDYDKDAVSIAKARMDTDAKGAFILRDVPSGDFELRAMAKDGKTGMVPVTVTGVDQSGLIIRLSPRTSVAGRVIDTNGKPVAGVYVFESHTDVPLATRFRRNGIFRGATTAADGSFRLVGLEPGIWELSVTEPRGNSNVAKIEVDLSDGADRTGLTITVEARDAQIRGNVLGPDRKPSAGAQVRAMREVPAARRKFDLQSEPVRTDATGNFVIDKLRPGTYTLVTEGPRGGTKADTSGVKTGDSVTIVLARLSSLMIAVTHRGAPALKVHLSCWGPVESLGLGADADGSHMFRDVAQGEWRCDAVSDDGSARASIVVGDEPAKLTLALEEYASLTGVAVSALTGQPVAGMTVMARGASAETEANGSFVVERVPAGTGELVLMPKDQLGGGHDKHPYTAKPGQRVDLGRIKVVPPRSGEVGTFGLTLEVRDNAVIVTRVRGGSPAERAGIRSGDSIAAVQDQAVSVLGLDRAVRLLASENTSVGQTLTLLLGRGARTTMTAVKW